MGKDRRLVILLPVLCRCARGRPGRVCGQAPDAFFSARLSEAATVQTHWMLVMSYTFAISPEPCRDGFFLSSSFPAHVN